MLYFGNALIPLSNYGPYVQIDNFLDKGECQTLSKYIDQRHLHDAKVDDNSKDGSKKTSIRSTKTCALDFVESTRWIFGKLEKAITDLNSQIYKYDILGFDEAIQMLRYDKEDHYDWHQDFSNHHHSFRKLSLSVQLTDPSEYEGGELEFFKNGTAKRDLGTLIMFPSFMHHRVLPITSGTRKALVAWIAGAPYR